MHSRHATVFAHGVQVCPDGCVLEGKAPENQPCDRTFLVRGTQLLPHTRYSDTESRTTVALAPHAEHVLPLKVVPGTTLEARLSPSGQ